MTIIDAHTHLWKKQDGVHGGGRVRALTNGRSDFAGEIRQMMPPYMLTGENNAEMLLSNMDYACVSGAVVTQEVMDGNQDGYLLSVRGRYPERFRVCSLYEEGKPFALEGFDGVKLCACKLKEQDLTRHFPVFEAAEKQGKFVSIDLADGDAQTASLREIVRQQSSMQPASQPQPAPQSRPAPAPRPQPAKPAPAPRPAAPKTPPALQGFQRTGTDGSDLTQVIRISPQENQQGCRKTFRYTRQIRCSGCLGKAPDSCSVCHGKGTMPHEEEITVSISAHPGQTSYTLPVMRGQGNAGTGNGSSGNLLVRVEVDSRQQPPPPKPAPQPAAPPSKPADTFSKDGDDLTVYVKVSRHENAKGCTKTVKYARKTCCRVCGGKGTSAGGRCRVCNGSGTITKTEELSVYIAPHPGQDRYTLPIIRGKGNAGLGSGRDGNLFIHVEVQSGWW